jgi:hypothetical protein
VASASSGSLDYGDQQILELREQLLEHIGSLPPR